MPTTSDVYLHQSLSQQQTLAPQMRKSLEILQAGTMELSQIISQALEINPVLEDVTESISLDEDGPDPEEADSLEYLNDTDDDWRDRTIMALVMLALLFLMQERIHSPEPMTEEGPTTVTCGDITFILERLLPRRGQGPCNEQDLCDMLTARIHKRQQDQLRRRKKNRKAPPPLWPDEVVNQMTE